MRGAQVPNHGAFGAAVTGAVSAALQPHFCATNDLPETGGVLVVVQDVGEQLVVDVDVVFVLEPRVPSPATLRMPSCCSSRNAPGATCERAEAEDPA